MEQNAGVLEEKVESPSIRAPPKIKLKAPAAEIISNNDSLPDLDSTPKTEENDLPDLVEEKPVEEVKVEQSTTEVVDTSVTIANPVEEVNNPQTETTSERVTEASTEQVTDISKESPTESTPSTITNPVEEVNNPQTETTSEQVTEASTEKLTETSTEQVTKDTNEPPIEQTQEEAPADPILTEETQIIKKINELDTTDTLTENQDTSNENNISEKQPLEQETIQAESQNEPVETKIYLDSATKNELEQQNPIVQDTQVTPKKRGRKPKPKPVLTEEELIALSTPKKRGRKPKIRVDEKSTISTSQEPVISENVASSSEVITETNPSIDVTNTSVQESPEQSTPLVNPTITDNTITQIQTQETPSSESVIQSTTNNSIQADNITKTSVVPSATQSSNEDLISRTPTGIPGFDELIEGGFPKNSSTLICGGPGCGKTIFCMQYLINGATQFNEKGLYVTFQQKASDLRKQAKQFGWDIEDLEYKGMIHIISLQFEKISGKTIQEIQKLVKKENINRLVIDSLSTLIINSLDNSEYSNLSVNNITENNILTLQNNYDFNVKKIVFNLFEQLKVLKTTNLLISEASQSGKYLSRDGLSEFVSDGIVLLNFESLGSEFSRNLQVRKMRVTNNSENLHPIEIGKTGIIVH